MEESSSEQPRKKCRQTPPPPPYPPPPEDSNRHLGDNNSDAPSKDTKRRRLEQDNHEPLQHQQSEANPLPSFSDLPDTVLTEWILPFVGFGQYRDLSSVSIPLFANATINAGHAIQQHCMNTPWHRWSVSKSSWRRSPRKASTSCARWLQSMEG